MNLHWIHKVMEGCSKGEGNRGLEAESTLGGPPLGHLCNCAAIRLLGQAAFTPLTLRALQCRHCHHPALQGQKPERPVNVPKVSQREWEAQGSALQPPTQQHPLCLGSAFSTVFSELWCWFLDGPDCPALVLMTFCHHHGTVTSASAVGDVISHSWCDHLSVAFTPSLWPSVALSLGAPFLYLNPLYTVCVPRQGFLLSPGSLPSQVHL